MNEQNNTSIEEKNGTNNFKTFFASSVGKIVLTVIFAVVIYGIIFAFVAMNNEYVALAICVVCGYFGWKALNKIQPSMFLWMSIAGWIVYFFIKGALSVVIGVFIAPFMIGKKISDSIAKTL